MTLRALIFGILTASVLLAFPHQGAHAEQVGRWSVTTFPSDRNGAPVRCDLRSPSDSGAQFLLTNARLEGLSGTPGYLGSARMVVIMDGTVPFTTDQTALPNAVITVPGSREWTVPIAVDQRGGGTRLTFTLDDNVAQVLQPLARGNVLEIRPFGANSAEAISISLRGSWNSVVLYESCIVM